MLQRPKAESTCRIRWPGRGINVDVDLEILTAVQLRTRLCAWAGASESAGGNDGKLMRIISDYIRHALVHVRSSESEIAQPVHVHQIRATLRQQLGSLFSECDLPPWEDPEDLSDAGPSLDSSSELTAGVNDVVLKILHALARVGDCAHLGRGFYLATPLRLIRLPSDGYLLIGGLPTQDMMHVTGLAAKCAGIARAVAPAHAAAVAASPIPRQDIADWLNLPARSLSEWTASMLQEARDGGLRTSGCDTTTFEIYAPGQQRYHSQVARWIPATRWRADARAGSDWWLCRSRMMPRRFWLSHFTVDTNGPNVSREYTVKPVHVRRLMYGIDQLAEASVSVKVTTIPGYGRQREVHLYSWPAWEEYQLLISLAADTTIFEAQHLPIKLHVADLWWPDCRSALEGLGIHIQEGTKPKAR